MTARPFPFQRKELNMKREIQRLGGEAGAAADDRRTPRGRGAELLAQLRRRADAAKRLPPRNGRRDPLTAAERALGRPRS